MISSLGITVLIIQLPHQLLRLKITRKGATNGQEEVEEEKEEVKPGYRYGNIESNSSIADKEMEQQVCQQNQVIQTGKTDEK